MSAASDKWDKVAENDMRVLKFDTGWKIVVVRDEDNHLNVYITNADSTDINETDTDIRCDGGGKIHLRFTTEGIEKEYAVMTGDI